MLTVPIALASSLQVLCLWKPQPTVSINLKVLWESSLPLCYPHIVWAVLPHAKTETLVISPHSPRQAQPTDGAQIILSEWIKGSKVSNIKCWASPEQDTSVKYFWYSVLHIVGTQPWVDWMVSFPRDDVGWQSNVVEIAWALKSFRHICYVTPSKLA